MWYNDRWVYFQPIKNFYLPFTYTKVIFEEYIEVDKKYKKEEALSLAKSKLDRVLNKLEENKILILKHNVNTDINSDYSISMGDIIVEESIVDYKKVEESEWRMEEEDELNGDSDWFTSKTSKKHIWTVRFIY